MAFGRIRDLSFQTNRKRKNGIENKTGELHVAFHILFYCEGVCFSLSLSLPHDEIPNIKQSKPLFHFAKAQEKNNKE